MLTRMFMTVREVAELARVSEATVRQWIRTGELRAIDVGREFRIIPGDLEAFLDRHATRPAGLPEQPMPPGTGAGTKRRASRS